MVDPRLINYIKSVLARGYSPAQIKQALLQRGWPVDEVNQALHLTQQPSRPSPENPPTPPANKPKKHPKKNLFIVLIIIAVLIVIITLALTGYFIFSKTGKAAQLSSSSNQSSSSEPGLESPAPLPDQSASAQSSFSNQSIPSGFVDCQNDIDCLINASKDCSPAQAILNTTFNLFGLIQTTTSFLKIGGWEGDYCLLFVSYEDFDVRFDSQIIQQMQAANISEEEIEQAELEATQEVGMFKGANGTCHFAPEDLTNLLILWKAGNFSTDDWDKTQCQGEFFEGVR